MEQQNAIVFRKLGGDLLAHAPGWLRLLAGAPFISSGYPTVRQGLELVASILEGVGGGPANAPASPQPQTTPGHAPGAPQLQAPTAGAGTAVAR